MNRKHSTKLSITIRQALVIIVTTLAIFSLVQPGNAGQCGSCQKKENIKKEKIEMEVGEQTKERADVLEYYARPGFMTDPKEYAELFDGLPTEISALCQIVQGIMIHIFWAERYGVKLSEERKQEVQIRAVANTLTRIRLKPFEQKESWNLEQASVMLRYG